jgi:uncharacterized protein with ParB-like and HNH nuclease domain
MEVSTMNNDILQNKIEANDTNINNLLKNQKFFIDYFQREYRWQEKHIKQLIEDLLDSFLKSYKEGDERHDVEKYKSYYLGSVVFSKNIENGKMSIIDGQQRITSITLLLIYLNNIQNKRGKEKVNISELIFSEKYGDKSFNMSDDIREECLKKLFDNGSYEIKDDDDESVKNMIARYEDISNSFPEEIIDEEKLPYFIDWFIQNVVVVCIIAYSDENAYTIFETMNDRGLNLTPTEMLKGYVLSNISDKRKRLEINDLWKKEIQKLHEYYESADQNFFQAWFRSKYAVSIRQGKVGAEDQDFELIGTRFHNWFRENHKKLFQLSNSEDFYKFFKNVFPFYVNLYISIKNGMENFDNNVPHLHYINYWGIAESLQDPLLMASINIDDTKEMIQKKLNFVSRFIETFTVRRSVNYKKFGQSAIRYTMLNIVKLIRNNDLSLLSKNLMNEINKIPEKWDGIWNFCLHGMNAKFVKHILSRISSYIDNLIGKDSTYVNYHHPDGKQFEIEHIWANKFDEHRDEFDQETDFNDWRNSIGALLLLPQGTNQSFSSDVYEDKLEHYLRENTYAQTLHQKFYDKNPNFLKSPIIQKLQFKPHPHFKKDDISDRQKLFQRICEEIWNIEYFEKSPNGA